MEEKLCMHKDDEVRTFWHICKYYSNFRLLRLRRFTEILNITNIPAVTLMV
jgi:hypothetical protein